MEEQIIAIIEKIRESATPPQKKFFELFEKDISYHALLLSGSAFGGQEFFGKWIAAKALSLSPNHLLTSHPDFLSLEDDSSGKTGIDTIKKLTAKLSQSPINGKHVVFFPHFENITPEAGNALLKTLEEPPAPTFFVCTTTQRDALMPTIFSRVIEWPVPYFSIRQISPLLPEVFSKITTSDLPSLEELSLGKVGLLLSLALCFEEENYEITKELLEEAANLVKNILSNEITSTEVIHTLSEFLDDSSLNSGILSPEEAFFLTFETTLERLLQEEKFTTPDALKKLEKISTALLDLRQDRGRNIHKKLSFLHFALRLDR